MAGRERVLLPDGDFVKLFSLEDTKSGEADRAVERMKNAHYVEVPAHPDKDCHLTGEISSNTGLLFKKKTKTKVKLFDGWYDILDSEDNYIGRRPTKELAEKYIKDLRNVKTNIMPPKEALPNHVRFLMDEFPNIGEVPEFLEKLSTIRKYEISVTVICQTITQLKGMYPDNYEVIDANCTQTIFLGGTENSNNEYISKKMGTATLKGTSNSIDNKKVSTSMQTEARELMKPEELGRMPKTKEIIIMDGEQPIYDDKFDYPKHKNYKYTNDYASDIGLRSAILIDRNMFAPIVEETSARAEVPTAVPEVLPFNMDAFKSVFRATSFEMAEEAFNFYEDDMEYGGGNGQDEDYSDYERQDEEVNSWGNAQMGQEENRKRRFVHEEEDNESGNPFRKNSLINASESDAVNLG